jgi:hypothetical protein
MNRFYDQRTADYTRAQATGTEYVEPSFSDLNRLTMETDALASVYSLTDKVLTKSMPTVHLVQDSSMSVPAMNDGKDIYINTLKYGRRVNDMDIASLHGLNYHEVAHLLYSPRVGSDLGKWVKENENYLRAFNILEDGRIEVLLTHKYPSVIPFINTAVIKLLSENLNPANFLVTRSRRHLPLEIRQVFAGMAVQEYGLEKTQALANYIDEFRLLNIFQKPDRAKEIIIGFDDLISDMDNPQSPNGCSKPIKDNWGRQQSKARPVMKAGRTETPKNIQDQLNEITKSDQSAEDLENLEGWDKADEQSDQQSDEQGNQQGDQQGDQQSRASQILEQAVGDMEGDEAINNEVSRIRKTVRESMGKAVVNNIKKGLPNNSIVSPQARVTAIKFARELEQLQADTDPSWVVEQPSGRVNIQRYMKKDPNALGKIFDRWSEGNYSHEIEAVILTDCSGSMGHVMQEANESAWVIKRALESIQGSVACYAFNESPKLIYTSDERTNASQFRNPLSSGGTNPTDCILAAHRTFTGSQKTTKLLFMITDGMWTNSKACDEMLREMEKEGVITIAIYLESPHRASNPLNINGDYYSWVDDSDKPKRYKQVMTNLFHDAIIKQYLTDPKQIIEVAKSVARSQIVGAL